MTDALLVTIQGVDPPGWRVRPLLFGVEFDPAGGPLNVPGHDRPPLGHCLRATDRRVVGATRHDERIGLLCISAGLEVCHRPGALSCGGREYGRLVVV